MIYPDGVYSQAKQTERKRYTITQAQFRYADDFSPILLVPGHLMPVKKRFRFKKMPGVLRSNNTRALVCVFPSFTVRSVLATSLPKRKIRDSFRICFPKWQLL